MLVAEALCAELLPTQPAEDRSTRAAVHPVAARNLLNGTSAAWARLPVLPVLVHPRVHSGAFILGAVQHGARKSVVCLGLTRCAHANVAFRALEDLSLILALCNAVYHWTVGGGAEASFVAIGQHVGGEGGRGKVCKFELAETRLSVEVSPGQGKTTAFLTAEDRQVTVLDGNGHLKRNKQGQVFSLWILLLQNRNRS